MNWEVYLKKKACLSESQSARKKVAYVTAPNIEEAKAIALSRRENAAFIVDGTPRRAS